MLRSTKWCVWAALSLSLSLSLLSPFVASTFVEEYDHALPMRDMYFVDQVEFLDHEAALRHIQSTVMKTKERDVEVFSRAQKEYEEKVTGEFVKETLLSRRHEQDHCPLGLSGPNPSDFYTAPTELSSYNGVCLNFGGTELNHNVCCKNSYYDSVGTLPRGGPFAASALSLVPTPTPRCNAKLTSFFCGVCSGHQESFIVDFSFASEGRFCQSYCDSLLSSCSSDVLADGATVDSVYGNDGAKFCYDLFGSVPSFRVTVIPDIEDGKVDKGREFCFSDAPECSGDDFTAFYTECDQVTNLRAVYFDYKPTSDCRGGHPLPDPILNLPCHQTCAPGHYLPIGETSCEECVAGTHSVGGYYVDQWKEWPPEFGISTYCERNGGGTFSDGQYIDPNTEAENGCRGWILNDTFIESGNTGDYQQSVLEFTSYLVRPGYITFDFKVLSELFFDGLFFLVDDKMAMQFVSQSLDWREFTYPLTSGFHTFRWIYFKDDSFAVNLDKAMIDRVLVVGTEWADSFCDLCTPGYYSNPGQALCTKCPADTYSNKLGSTKCDECLPSQYSVLGSSECFDRPTCTEDDFYFYYTPCNSGVRNKIFAYKEPILCHSAIHKLPDNEIGIACAPCNPGMYRPEGASSCTFCSDGEYSSTVGSLTCSRCPGGSSALKTLYLTQFDSWEETGMWSNCVGDCGTSGWRLLSETIDSGDGHGPIVDVNLYLNVTIKSYGILQFTYDVKCSHICRYQIIDVGVTGGTRTYYATSSLSNQNLVIVLPLAAGNHTLRWVFSKIDPTVLDSTYDRLIIKQILVFGVTGGGATGCSICAAGTAAEAGQSECQICPKGTYSIRNSSSCTPCDSGFYSNVTGASSCLACGNNTVSLPDRTDCDYNGCRFSPARGIEYDLSPLSIAPGADLYGPIWDQKGHSFYLSPCVRSHSNRSCYNINKEPIHSHACQPLPLGYAMDLGYIQGYLPLNDTSISPDPIRSGLVLRFTQGTPGCAGGGKPASPRSANIKFVCNPMAGIGYPVTVEPVESPSCTYNFVWSSSYACPLCTENDYEIVHGQCIAGLQTKSHVPKFIPNRCVGGISAPPLSQVPCVVTSTVCPPGTYLPPGIENSENPCVPAKKGRYTIGGGIELDFFNSVDDLPTSFDHSGGWKMLGELTQSGEGDTALTANVFLVRAGEVSFEYEVVAPSLVMDETNGFHFTIDGVLQDVMTYTTRFRYVKAKFAVPSGEHVLKWRFVGGVEPTALTRGAYVSVSYIAITGTDFAARADIPCRAGRYQDEEGQTSCKICPEGTFSHGGAETCAPCAPAFYSVPESSDCTVRPRCEPRDIVVRTTPCSGKNNSYFKYNEPLQPQICLLDKLPFNPNLSSAACAACPVGYTLSEEGICQPCSLGTTWNADSKKCDSVPPGSYANLINSYVINPFTKIQYIPDRLPSYSPGFYTFTSGEHFQSGWRLLNDTIDSGFHSSMEVDSVLIYVTKIAHAGSITFSYQLTTTNYAEIVNPIHSNLDGLEFFINGNIQNDRLVPYHPQLDVWQTATFTLPMTSNGDYFFAWVYHQPHGSFGHHRVVLKDISIVGGILGTSLSVTKCPRGTSSAGGGASCTPCAVGFEAPSLGSVLCTLCKNGYYAESNGTADCDKCGVATSSSPDRSTCDISACKFQSGNIEFDLTRLAPASVVKDDLRLELSVCNKVRRESMCFDESHKLLSTYSCEVDLNNGIATSRGRLPNVYYDSIPNPPKSQLRLSYTKGSLCSMNGDFSTTDVSFVCDVDTKGDRDGLTVLSNEPCSTKLQWKNIAGCPVCVAEDYTDQLGVCKDGKQTVSSVRVGACNGPEVKEVKKRNCTASYSVSTPLALIFVLVFVILAIGIVFISIRNKNLHDKYEMLVTESASQRSTGGEASWGTRDDEKL